MFLETQASSIRQSCTYESIIPCRTADGIFEFVKRMVFHVTLGLHAVVTIAEHALKLLTIDCKYFLSNVIPANHYNYVKSKAYVESLTL